MKPLALIEKFLEGMSAEGISYCHWKSTTRIMASLCGDTDLDLLVAADRREDCLTLLGNLGFREARDSSELDLPGISHYFGLDRTSGKLVHVHLHFQLIVGDDLLKNYRLPVEKAFFASSRFVSGIAIPSPEVEFITFVLRMTLKRRLLSVLVRLTYLMGSLQVILKQLAGAENPRLSREAYEEFEDLQGKINEENLQTTLLKGFPMVAPELFQQCRDSLEKEARGFAWLTAGNRLARALKDYRRLRGLLAPGKMFLQGFRLRVRAVLTRAGYRCLTGKTLVSGARIMAFVDEKGTTKGVLPDDIARWFGRYFSIVRLPPARLADGLAGKVVLGWNIFLGLLSGRGGDPLYRREHSRLYSRAWLRTWRKACRLRRRGMVVLLDGFPSAELSFPFADPGGAVDRCLARLKQDWQQRVRVGEVLVLQTDSQDLTPLPEMMLRMRSLVWDGLGRGRIEQFGSQEDKRFSEVETPVWRQK